MEEDHNRMDTKEQTIPRDGKLPTSSSSIKAERVDLETQKPRSTTNEKVAGDREGTNAAEFISSSKPKAYCCSSSSVYSTDWSSTSLLQQSVFEAYYRNVLVNPNEKAGDGADWTIKYVGNAKENLLEGFDLPSEIADVIRQMAELPVSRHNIESQGLFNRQNEVLKEWIFGYICYALRRPFAKANANAEFLSAQDILPHLNEYLVGKQN
jgi:hypothetical protein